MLCVITANLIKNDVKIVDIVHSNFGELNLPWSDTQKYLSDILVLLQTVYCVAIIDAGTLSELFLIMGLTQLCRVLCSASTVLPPLKNYGDKYRLGGINGTGTEYIFSGHASYSCISFIYLSKSMHISILSVYNFISQFLIILTRNHYTVDIVLAWIIVPLIYGNVVLCNGQEKCREMLEWVY
jgi:hypothetical protein